MSRVIAVSNRVIDPTPRAQAGGVAVAISDFLARNDGAWLGWSGKVTDMPASAPNLQRAGDISLLTLPLTVLEYRGFYLGYSNSVLWPVFHNRVDLAQFEAGHFAVYTSVNRRFAEALIAMLRPDDVIWIHDYHFLTMGLELRRAGIRNRLGFYLHIPFPPSQAFLTIPEHKILARAFAAYDYVGLQSSNDVGQMIDYIVHGAFGHVLPDGRLRVDDREFSIGSIPVGIDVAYFRDRAMASGASARCSGVKRIIGVDRLDYTKGLPQKFRAFGRFLESWPDSRNSFVLTQIAAPSRESLEAYEDIRKQLERLSGAINGAYGDLDWVPINYINRSAPRDELAAIYRSSAMALVTPLRDGMNLVAKEYVAAQDPEDPGVLILSRFAGAAERMRDALIVNPYNIDEIAEAIRRAAIMPRQERVARHRALFESITQDDAHAWAHSFLRRLGRSGITDGRSPCDRLDRAMSSLGESEGSIDPTNDPTARGSASGTLPVGTSRFSQGVEGPR